MVKLPNALARVLSPGKSMTSSKTQQDVLPVFPLLNGDDQIKISILIPCLYKEKTITKTVVDFKTQLEGANVYLVDNASTDNTAQRTREAVVFVISEKCRGKGYTEQAMFQKIEANINDIVDGDDTYLSDRAALHHDWFNPAYDQPPVL
jgi:glycosyltransferase involved in cell wall biosynthesis